MEEHFGDDKSIYDWENIKAYDDVIQFIKSGGKK